jgi:hypothetical protein
VYPLWLCCRRSTTIQPDTPPTFKFLNTRFSYNSHKSCGMIMVFACSFGKNTAKNTLS